MKIATDNSIIIKFFSKLVDTSSWTPTICSAQEYKSNMLSNPPYALFQL